MSQEKEISCNINSSNKTLVKLGNGELVKLKGMCSISIQTKHGTNHIRNIFLIPNIHENFHILGELLEYGYKLEFYNNMCKIYDKKDKIQVMTIIEMKKKLFISILNMLQLYKQQYLIACFNFMV